jgi:hypothetical protein
MKLKSRELPAVFTPERMAAAIRMPPRMMRAASKADRLSLNFRAPLASAATSLCVHVLVLLTLSFSHLDEKMEERIAVRITTASSDEDVLHEAVPEELEIVLDEPEEIEPDEVPVITDTANIELVSYDTLVDNTAASFESDALGTANLEDLLASVAEGGTADAESVAHDVDERVEQAGGKRGYMQVSLVWNNRNDLDLELITPSGEKMWAKHPRSRCGGTMDIDANWTDVRGSTKHVTDRPVENIVWEKPPTKNGTYRVYIDCYSIRNGDQRTPYSVVIRVNEKTLRFSGEVATLHKRILVGTFNPSDLIAE